MSEKKISTILNAFETILHEYARDEVSFEDTLKAYSNLKYSIGATIARYCDDFSTLDFHKYLKEGEEDEQNS